jgi:hypothetical protein
MKILAGCILLGGCSSASATGDAGGDAATSGATVVGTLTLPGTAAGKSYFVRIVTATGMAALMPTAQTSGSTTGSTMLPYSIANVPAGTYFILGFVDVNNSGGTASTPGDYAGWYGHDASGNPPAAPNAVVPATGTVTFDFSLVLR